MKASTIASEPFTTFLTSDFREFFQYSGVNFINFLSAAFGVLRRSRKLKKD